MPSTPPPPCAWNDPGQPWPPKRLTWWTRWRLRRVKRLLREQLFRIADEKEACIDHHSDSDCGFQLLKELE